MCALAKKRHDGGYKDVSAVAEPVRRIARRSVTYWGDSVVRGHSAHMIAQSTVQSMHQQGAQGRSRTSVRRRSCPDPPAEVSATWERTERKILLETNRKHDWNIARVRGSVCTTIFTEKYLEG